MRQVLFHLPDWLPRVGGNPVHSFGVMMVIGFFAGLQLAKFLARRSRIDPELFVTAGIIALVSGVAGARLSHVLENLGDYTRPDRSFGANLWDAVNISSGGLTFYGGVLLATPVTIAYGLVKKIPIRVGMDVIAPCLMIGLGFGRIGCLLNGCCYGAECSEESVPWAIRFPYHSNAYLEEVQKGEITPPPALLGQTPEGRQVPLQPAVAEVDPVLRDLANREHSRWLHPAQVYSTLTAWLLAALLVAYFSLPHAPGRVFALMLMLEAPSRFVLEMLRAEPPVVGPASSPPHLTSLPNMSFSMVLSIGLLLLGVVLWSAFGRSAAAAGRARMPQRAPQPSTV